MNNKRKKLKVASAITAITIFTVLGSYSQDANACTGGACSRIWSRVSSGIRRAATSVSSGLSSLGSRLRNTRIFRPTTTSSTSSMNQFSTTPTFDVDSAAENPKVPGPKSISNPKLIETTNKRLPKKPPHKDTVLDGYKPSLPTIAEIPETPPPRPVRKESLDSGEYTGPVEGHHLGSPSWLHEDSTGATGTKKRRFPKLGASGIGEKPLPPPPTGGVRHKLRTYLKTQQ